MPSRRLPTKVFDVRPFFPQVAWSLSTKAPIRLEAQACRWNSYHPWRGLR